MNTLKGSKAEKNPSKKSSALFICQNAKKQADTSIMTISIKIAFRYCVFACCIILDIFKTLKRANYTFDQIRFNLKCIEKR